MSRSFGFQQQSYAVHQEAVQQQSYGVEAAWHSKNQYLDSQFVLMPPAPCIDPQAALLKHHNKSSRKHAVHQNGWHQETTSAHYYNNHVSAGNRMPFNAWNASNFSNDQMEENAEYETSFHEVRVPATVLRVQERRYYERSSTWGDNTNPCRSSSYDENISFNGYGKSAWVPRGL